MLESIKSFNSTVWFIIIQTLLSRFTMFMVWPFLALILHDKFGLNEFEIGLFLSLSLVFGIIVGFFAGNISDKIGREKVILVGLLVNVVAMLIMGMADNLYLFFIGSILQSISRSLVENPGKALMTDILKNQKVKEMSLHLRYFAINIGAAFGPIVGINLGFTGQQNTFNLVALTYFISFLIAISIFKIKELKKVTVKNDNQSFKTLFSILKQDHAFLIFIFANALTFMCFIQIDAGLLQYLRIANFEEVTKLYATLIFVNGMTIILLQFLLLKLLHNFAPLVKGMIGISLFVLAFITFAYVEHGNSTGIILAMVILSIGEVILFPTINIIIDKMAPSHLKGSYFGVAELSVIGVALAPLLGGFLLEVYDGKVLWLCMAAISFVVSILLFIAQTAKRPEVVLLEDDKQNDLNVDLLKINNQN